MHRRSAEGSGADSGRRHREVVPFGNRVSFDPLRRPQVYLRTLAALACAACLVACGSSSSSTSAPAALGVQRLSFTGSAGNLVVEILADDVVHFEWSAAEDDRDPSAPILTTPMVAKTDYVGPTRFGDDGHGGITTAALTLAVSNADLCLTLTDISRQPPLPLTTICPQNLSAADDALAIAPAAIEHVYGLGEHFLTPDTPNGDWVGQVIAPGNDDGNDTTNFNGGVIGNAQFPIMYALGDGGENYALFLDHLYAQRWDFSADPWVVHTSGDPVRGYLFTGADLPALRARYMELVGHPLVPPKKLFGLWVSEFGYDDWGELEDKLSTLRAHAFPVDGFVLDLEWFGNILPRPSHMGDLIWDESHFPDPAGEIARLRDDNGVGLMTIEEPYVDASLPEHAALADNGYLVRQCDGCDPLNIPSWWGTGGMIDWTNAAAGDYWHDAKRQALADMGILGHWTDLGEPESYDPTAWYFGFPALDLHADRDVHNLYNFKWLESIHRGYARNGTQRSFELSRSGTSGIQRFGAAMWSGDIGSNLSSLSTHFNVQMHMSFSGVDYFGADIGGYWRTALQGDLNDVYTRWFADGMAVDVPGRPHTFNVCNCYETAPDRVGDLTSNQENLRQRYRFIPYVYSLAHRAYLFGEPVIPPLVFYYQDDPNVRDIGDEKLIGRDLLVAMAGVPGAAARDVYLPAGTWINVHTNDRIASSGQSIVGVPFASDGVFRLPLFARAGAIIPEMAVDEQTMNALGQRLDGSVRDELIVRVYSDPTPNQFTLYEDDGHSTAYQQGGVRTTVISQRAADHTATVIIGASNGSYDGAAESRNVTIELVHDPLAAGVSVNGDALPEEATRADFEAAERGWFTEEGVTYAKSGVRFVGRTTTFAFRF